MDSNRDNNDEYKKALINLVKENGIKLVIDLHGASLLKIEILILNLGH